VKKPTDADEGSRAEDFRLEEFLPYRLCIAAESVSHLMARHYLTDLDLVLPEWRLLAAVGRFGILSPTHAGERTAMDKVKVSRAAASLVARGLLRQTQDPADGRGRLLRLTRKGTTSYTNVAPTARAIEAALAPGLTKAEWGALAKALGKLSDHARSVLAEKAG
jgi:DNA-binding MarR family transcriptional regulator